MPNSTSIDYKNLIKTIGLKILILAIPFTRDDIQSALKNGDESLSSLSPNEWLHSAGFISTDSSSSDTKIDNIFDRIPETVNLNCMERIYLLKEAAKEYAAMAA